MPYQFKGINQFLGECRGTSTPATVARARNSAGLSDISKLLAQAVAVEPAKRAIVMDQARIRFEALELSYHAGKAMIEEVESELGIARPATDDAPAKRKARP